MVKTIRAKAAADPLTQSKPALFYSPCKALIFKGIDVPHGVLCGRGRTVVGNASERRICHDGEKLVGHARRILAQPL